MKIGPATALATMVLFAGSAGAEPAAVPPLSTSTPAPSAPCCHLDASATVQLDFPEPVSSRRQKIGDQFKLRLAEPVMVGDQVIVPAGVTGVGEVVDVAPPGIGGRPGKLILAARYLDYGSHRIALRSLKFAKVGQDNTSAALVAGALIGLPGYFITGGNIDIPVGARAEAKLSGPLDLPPVTPAAPALASETPTEQKAPL